MLNIVLRNKLDKPEYRLNYDMVTSGLRLTDQHFISAIRTAVQNVRKTYTAKGQDDLAWKLDQFGNNGNWAAVKIKELEKVLFDENKRPHDEFKGAARSVEFECIFTDEKALQDFYTAIRCKGFAKYVTVKKDNSLRTDEDDKNAFCKEICVSYKAGDEKIGENMLRYVCEQMDSPALRAEQMKRLGRNVGRAYVNNTCGLHVHFDMRVIRNAQGELLSGIDAEKQVKQYGQRLARCVPALKMMLPKSRRNNFFCQQAINELPRATDKQLPVGVIDKERYSFINMKSYRRFETLEVRGHSGTLNADKILNWIALCEKIMMTRIRHKSETHEIRNPLELIKIYKLDDKLAQYVMDRFVGFNTAREREMFAVPAARNAQGGNAGKPWEDMPVPEPIDAPFDDWQGQ